MIWKRAVGSCMKPWKWLETSARIYPKGGVDTDHAMTIQAYKTT